MTKTGKARVVAVALLVVALVMIVWKANERGSSHDEHQFVAPGLLTMETGLLPYRDYPLFHVPVLVFIHAAVASLTDFKLLAVRLFTAVNIWLTVVLLACFARRQFHRETPMLQVVLASAIGGLFVFSPVFPYTARFIWNHGTPTLFILAAWLLHAGASMSPNSGRRLFASGLLVALAAGMRLTLAPLAAPFALAIVLLSPGWTLREKARGLALFAAGGILGALPCLYFFLIAPEQFLFCNLESARYAQVWRELPFWSGDLSASVDPDAGLLHMNLPALKGLPILDKLMFFVTASLAVHWPTFVGALALGVSGLIVGWREVRERIPAAFACLCLPFVIWGCFAPSRFNRQYPYILVLFLILIIAAGLPSLLARKGARKWALGILTALTTCQLFLGAADYAGLKGGHKIRNWGSVRTHARALEIREKLPPRSLVLTFEAFYMQEAGLEVYPELVSGQFPWRLAHLIPAEKRALFHLLGPGDLDARLAKNPPNAVLLADDPEIGAPFAEYAERHGFQLIDKKRGLWKQP